MDKYTLLAVRNSGINWFYWITGLSLINTVLNISDGGYGFIIGLGYTQFIDAIMLTLRDDGNRTMMIIAFFASILVSGFFALSGYLTQFNKKGWYLVAMILYVIDISLYLYAEDYIGIGFHIFALVYIYRGYIAHIHLLEMNAKDSEK